MWELPNYVSQGLMELHLSVLLLVGLDDWEVVLFLLFYIFVHVFLRLLKVKMPS